MDETAALIPQAVKEINLGMAASKKYFGITEISTQISRQGIRMVHLKINGKDIQAPEDIISSRSTGGCDHPQPL